MFEESISVVVPMYNSEASLPLLIRRLEPVVREFQSADVILVNDGSRDGSWAVVEDLVAQFDFVRGIDLMRNYGQHNSLLCGIRSARGRIIVTMDDDLQNPPEEIPLLVAKLRDGYDVVYGTPERETHGFLRDMASRITKLALQAAMGAQTARKVSSFRAFRTPLRDIATANRILSRLEAMPDFAQIAGVVLVGGQWGHLSPLKTVQAEMNISALFAEWSKLPLLNEVSGYDLQSAPPAMVEKAKGYCMTAPRWPSAQAVTCIDSFAAICQAN